MRLSKIFFAIIFSFLISNTTQARMGYLDYSPDVDNISKEIYMNTEIPLTQEGFDYYLDDSGQNLIIMLPLRAVLYEYADISWNADENAVDIRCGTLDISLVNGKTGYIINGERAEFDAAPKIIDGRTYVPSTFFEKAFGFWISDATEGVLDLFIPSYIIENI